MNRRSVLRSIGALGIGTAGITRIDVGRAQDVDPDLLEALLDTTAVERLHREFAAVNLVPDRAEQVDVTFDRDVEERSGFRVVHVPSDIGRVSVMLMGEHVVSLQVAVNRFGKYQMAYGLGPERIPSPGIDEVAVVVAGDRTEVVRGVDEEERAAIADVVPAAREELVAYNSTVEEGYTVIQRAGDDVAPLGNDPGSLSVGDEIEVYNVSPDMDRTLERRSETFGRVSDDGPQVQGDGERVVECVANSALCIGTLDVCFKCQILCLPSKIPGNPSFAGFVAACLICVSHTCGHELTSVLGEEAGSCETMLCCLSDFAQYISGDRIDPEGLVEAIPTFSCKDDDGSGGSGGGGGGSGCAPGTGPRPCPTSDEDDEDDGE